MQNFDWTKFTTRIAIKAKPSVLYNAWTQAQEIEKWFLSKADFFDEQGKRIADIQSIEPDFSYAWQWYTYDLTEKGKILEANGNDLIRFTFAGDCIVTVKLSQNQDFTLVELTQENIPTDDESKANIRLGCESGWSFYLVNLKSVYEGGLDLRNKTADFKPVVN